MKKLSVILAFIFIALSSWNVQVRSSHQTFSNPYASWEDFTDNRIAISFIQIQRGNSTIVSPMDELLKQVSNKYYGQLKDRIGDSVNIVERVYGDRMYDRSNVVQDTINYILSKFIAHSWNSYIRFPSKWHTSFNMPRPRAVLDQIDEWQQGKLSIGKGEKPKLYSCRCKEATPFYRIKIILQQLGKIFQHFPDKTQPFVHTAFAEGGLLQTYLLMNCLLYAGYTNVHLNVIGPDINQERVDFFFNKIKQNYPDVVFTITWYPYAKDYIETGEKSDSFDVVDIDRPDLEVVTKDWKTLLEETPRNQNRVVIFDLNSNEVTDSSKFIIDEGIDTAGIAEVSDVG